ncbi:hypothetical protein [Streptomyces lichenis]|uniref:Tetratricopeptide repeat protein n=1 Tax=Streptomyces lichenis TaxID=2306967 RepID=A0ABT0I5S8_9ACTN|nr:hypothetical protein [Streptomyces lichenis]MCK8676667.1 hypothetical protein [Streptomyces lichenis]
MKPERVCRVVLGAGAGAVALVAALIFVPWPGPGGLLEGVGRPPAAGAGGATAVVRAETALRAGARVPEARLAALVADRERWLRAHPKDEAVWAELGTAYLEAGDPAAYGKAEGALRRSLALRPAARGNAAGQTGMGALAAARGDWAAARRWGEAAAKAAPEGWRAQAVLADAYTGLGDSASAAKAVERLRELAPHAAAGMGRAAEAYWQRAWREDASAAAFDAVALTASPLERSAALTRVGELAFERGEPADALGAYDEALRAAPKAEATGRAAALAGRARALAALGRGEEALRGYAAALQARPLPGYALAAAEAAEALGDQEAAREYGELLRAKVAERAAHGVDGALVLARWQADHGGAEEAVEALMERWWVRRHRSPQVADALGWALLRADRARDALPYARRAHEQGPRNALPVYHRGMIEQALGLAGPARRHLTEALRINPSFSPLGAPAARQALEELGEPAEGGPKDVYGSEVPQSPGVPKAKPKGPRPAKKARE